MELQYRLEVLTQQYNEMIKYKAVCNSNNSTINYSTQDFEREHMLGEKIQETKNWINGKKTDCI